MLVVSSTVSMPISETTCLPPTTPEAPTESTTCGIGFTPSSTPVTVVVATPVTIGQHVSVGFVTVALVTRTGSIGGFAFIPVTSLK